MNTKRFLVSNAIFLLLTACGSGKQYSGFDLAETPVADSIAITQLLNPSDWGVHNGKALIYSQKTDDIFYVYSLPEFEFMYSFGKVGQGPGEFHENLRLPPKNSSLKDFYVNGFPKKEISRYSLEDKQVDIKATKPYLPKDGVFSSLYVFSNDLSLSKSTDTDTSIEYLYLQNTADGKVFDSIVISSAPNVLVSDNKQQYQKSETNPAFIQMNGDRVAVFYTFTQRVEIYEVTKDNKFKFITAIGPEIDQAEIERIKTLRADRSGQKGIIMNCSTSKYIYNLEVDIRINPEKKSPELISSEVYVYDWDGQPVKRISLSRPATDILVSDDNSKIYTMSKLVDTEQVFVYPTGL